MSTRSHPFWTDYRATGADPWTRRDARKAGVLAAGGLLGLAVCWYGLSGEAAYQDQMPWLFGAILSVVVVGIALASWLLVGVRAVHENSRELVEELRAHGLRMLPGGPTGALAANGRALEGAAFDGGADSFVTGGSMTRVHRPTCLLVRGKPVTGISAAEASARNLGRCGACCR